MAITRIGPGTVPLCNIVSVRALTLIFVMATFTVAPWAEAQDPAAPAGRPADSAAATSSGGIAIGVVFDSVRARPLSGAIIRLDSSSQVTMADDNGRFRLDSIPPGPHHLRVEHPMLDTLGVALRSPVENFRPGAPIVVVMATPSAETLIRMVCTPAWRARGPAAFFGRVREADTGTPAVGAKVSLVWYEIDVSGGLRRAPRVREATVGADGTYRICGLPAQLEGRVQVMSGPLTSGEISVEFGTDLLFVRNMSIAPASAVVATRDSGVAGVRVLGSARLTGRVLNASGQPISGARVQLDGTPRTAVTRQNGEFLLDSLPPGTQSVTVRHLGYAPVEEAVDLASAEPSSVTIRMSDYVPVLETVRVTAARERALDVVGYARRKRSGLGHYLEGDQINTHALHFSDVLRTVPGIRVQTAGMGRQVVTSTRGVNGCVMFWVDGTPWQSMEPGDIDDFVKPHELGAIEVYSPTNTPAEFQNPQSSSCTTVIGWTSRRLDRNRRR